MPDINFDCAHCGQNIDIDERGAGRTVTCPSCGRLITVPVPAGQSHEVPAAPEYLANKSGRSKALSGLVLSVVSFWVLGPLLAVPGVVLAHLSRRGGSYRHDSRLNGLSLAALICGYLTIAASLFTASLFTASLAHLRPLAGVSDIARGKQESGLKSMAITYADVVLDPGRHLNKDVLMYGTFAAKDFDRESFSIRSSDQYVEVFFDKLGRDSKAMILKTDNFSRKPVYAVGRLRAYSNNPRSYYIEAKAVQIDGVSPDPDFMTYIPTQRSTNTGSTRKVVPFSLSDITRIVGKPSFESATTVQWGSGVNTFRVRQTAEPSGGMVFEIRNIKDSRSMFYFAGVLTSQLFTHEERKGIEAITETAQPGQQVTVGRFLVSWKPLANSDTGLSRGVEGVEYTMFLK